MTLRASEFWVNCFFKKWFHILNAIMFFLFMTEALYKAGGVSLLIWRGVTVEPVG